MLSSVSFACARVYPFEGWKHKTVNIDPQCASLQFLTKPGSCYCRPTRIGSEALKGAGRGGGLQDFDSEDYFARAVERGRMVTSVVSILGTKEQPPGAKAVLVVFNCENLEPDAAAHRLKPAKDDCQC